MKMSKKEIGLVLGIRTDLESVLVMKNPDYVEGGKYWLPANITLDEFNKADFEHKEKVRKQQGNKGYFSANIMEELSAYHKNTLQGLGNPDGLIASVFPNGSLDLNLFIDGTLSQGHNAEPGNLIYEGTSNPLMGVLLLRNRILTSHVKKSERTYLVNNIIILDPVASKINALGFGVKPDELELYNVLIVGEGRQLK